MNTTNGGSAKDLMSNWRWWICSLLFFATTINYMDRQVLSLTYEEFIKPEFHWTDADYGTVTSFFSIFYAFACLFAGKFIDWVGTRKGYIISIILNVRKTRKQKAMYVLPLFDIFQPWRTLMKL